MSEWDLPDDVETTKIERVGGGGYTWESGVYLTTIDLVYLDQRDSEAIFLNAVLKNDAGKELKEAFCIKSGKDKGKRTWYISKKDGKKYPLPGYSIANSLCISALGKSLADCLKETTKKMVEVYDYKEGKTVPTEKYALMNLVGKAVKVAVHQVKQDKTKKNDATGKYDSTGETKVINECKFFGNTAGVTAEEIEAGEEATMFDKWAEKNTGTVIDKSTKKTGASAADIMGGGTAAEPAASTKSLFT